MNVCEFCKKEFATKGNLVMHQRTAKFCLEIQGKTIEDFKCRYCNKNFTSTQHLNEHYNSCKVKKEEDKKLMEEKTQLEYNTKIKNIVEKYEKKIEENNKDHIIEIDILNKTIDKLEKKLESYEKRLFDMASRPNTTNTNNNKTVVINNENDENKLKPYNEQSN